VILFAWGRPGLRGGLHRIPASGGMPTSLAGGESTSGASRWPQFLPGGGGRFLYTVSSPVAEEDGLYLASLDGRAGDQPVRVMSSDYPAQYVEPGYLLFVRDGVLLAQPFDAGTGSLGGAPMTIAPRVAVSPDVNFRSAELSVSAGGAFAYLRMTPVKDEAFQTAGPAPAAVAKAGRVRL
jgi:hypothetical protein